MMKRLGILGVILATAVAVAATQDTAPVTRKVTPVVLDFGSVTITRGQTARLGVVAVDPPEPDLPPGPCRVELAFFFPNGEKATSKSAELDPGKSAFLDASPVEADALTDGIMIVRAKVTIIGPERKLPPGPCRASVEVIDNETQQTRMILSPAEIRGFNPQPDPPGKEGRVPPGADRGFNPQPDPPGFPMLGITAGQSFRIHVANVATRKAGGVPPDPCRAKIALVDADGGLLVPAVQVIVDAGESRFVPMDGAEILKGTELRRRQVRPVVVYVPPDPNRGAFPPGPCIPVVTLELVDTRTGQSQLILSPATIRGFNPQPDPPGTPPIIIGPEGNR